METACILKADLLDIIFEGRNKSYGAYELRRNYENRMISALVITGAICLLLAGGAWIHKILYKGESTPPVRILEGLTISEITPEEKKLPEPPPPPARKTEAPKVKTIKLIAPIIASDLEVPDPPPTQDEIRESRIGLITQNGVDDASIVIPPESHDVGKGILPTPVKSAKENLPFTKVEIEASYIGNWKNFLERNLSPEVPIENGATPGTYTVIIQFVVDINGMVSDIKALTNHGFGMEQEAMRVIKKSGKWRPAFQNKNEVRAFRRQPIIFQVLEQ